MGFEQFILIVQKVEKKFGVFVYLRNVSWAVWKMKETLNDNRAVLHATNEFRENNIVLLQMHMFCTNIIFVCLLILL